MLNRFVKKILNRVKRARFSPHIDNNSFLPTIRLGTSYGGWNFVDRPILKSSTIVSCGLGEDASFDIEFARKYDATVLIVDPTPRAVMHYNQIVDSIKKGSSVHKCSDHEYCLTDLRASQLLLLPKALWINGEKVRFYSPPNPEHVSHSITNYQNNYRNDTDFMEVDSITINELLESRNISKLPLLKLDIEGAENSVLPKMMADKILPDQILVEFDELNLPSKKAKLSFSVVDNRLRQAGYRLAHSDMGANFLYVLD